MDKIPQSKSEGVVVIETIVSRSSINQNKRQRALETEVTSASVDITASLICVSAIDHGVLAALLSLFKLQQNQTSTGHEVVLL